jgi:hypothetical protein
MKQATLFVINIFLLLFINTIFFSDALPQIVTQKFAAENSQPIKQIPTRPIPLSSSGYDNAFNALMQVLWVLEPFNAMLREEKLHYHFEEAIRTSYLASIDAKNTLSGPLSLNPFIEIMNTSANKTLVYPTDILNIFLGSMSGNAYTLFLVNYSQRTYCENKTKMIHTPEDLDVPPQPKYLTVHVAQKSTNLQESLTSAQELDAKCICGKNLKRSLKLLDQYPPKILVINTDRQGEGVRKVSYPYTFPLFNLKFGNKVYDLVGIIFHAGESIDKGHYYAWIEYDGTWYKCNDEEIKSFAEMKKETKEKNFKDADYFNFIVPLSETNLLVYLEKPLHIAQLMQSSFARATLQKKQRAISRDVWQQKEGFIDQRIKNFGATIEQNLKKQWDPVFQGMLNA